MPGLGLASTMVTTLGWSTLVVSTRSLGNENSSSGPFSNPSWRSVSPVPTRALGAGLDAAGVDGVGLDAAVVGEGAGSGAAPHAVSTSPATASTTHRPAGLSGRRPGTNDIAANVVRTRQPLDPALEAHFSASDVLVRSSAPELVGIIDYALRRGEIEAALLGAAAARLTFRRALPVPTVVAAVPRRLASRPGFQFVRRTVPAVWVTGRRVLRFTWTMIEEYPERVLETVRTALGR